MTTEPLSKEKLRFYWSKTYNDMGKPDWSHIFKFYAENIVFQDTIQKIEGFKDFESMCHRLTKRCKQLRMDIKHVQGDDKTIFFEWTMTMIFRRMPSTPIYGSSRLTLNDEGLIVEQRDYYDLWGDIYNGVPIFKRLYRFFMRKIFG